LIGHFVNYRKQASTSLQDLLPEADFRLFAVCVRYPHNLDQRVPLTRLGEGVYEVRGLGLCLRVIVVNQLPKAEHNAILHLFSAREELLRYAKAHYRPQSPETSSLLYQLFQAYSEEADMSDKLKEFVRQTLTEVLARATPEERLAGLTAEERLKGLPAEERLKGLPAEERLKGLSTEEVLRALPPETLEEIARRAKANGSSSKPQ
jgi:hypothetical protein